VDEDGAVLLRDRAERLAPALRGYEASAALAELEARHDDLLAALAWFIGQDRPDDALRLSSALVPFWMATKRIDEGRAWFDRVLALNGGDDARRGKALFNAGYLAFWQGDEEPSAAFYRQALEVGRATANPTVEAIALTGLARIALRTDVEEARRLCLEALALSDATGDPEARGHATHVLGVAAQMAGNLPEARQYMTERIDIARAAGDIATVSSEAANLSMVERQLGNLGVAELLAREALEFTERRGHELMIAWLMNGWAALAVDRDQHERGAILLGAADALLAAQGGVWPPDEWVFHEQTAVALTHALGNDEVNHLRVAARSMSSRQAVDFALRRAAETTAP